jgi:hypothetical protein
MNKLLWILSLVFLNLHSFSQDTISTNIYQYDSNLGIGITDPSYFLEIKNDVNSGIKRNFIKLQNVDNSSYTGLLFQSGTDGAKLSGFQEYGLNYNSGPHYDFGGFFNISSKVRGIMLHANSADGIIKFYTGHDETAGAGIERLRIDSQGNIGIGTDNPSRNLDINGSMKLTPLMMEPENPMEGDIYMDGANHQLKFFDGSEWKSLINNSDSLWKRSGDGLYYDEGNIGIGSTNPKAKLQIADGDIYISDIEKGIIMKSPNGQCWRGTLDDSGNLNFMMMYCPDVPLKSHEINSLSNMVISPVPAVDYISIEMSGTVSEKLSYSVFDINGKLLKKGKTKSNTWQLDISKFKSGIHILEITDRNRNKLFTKKFIKH